MNNEIDEEQNNNFDRKNINKDSCVEEVRNDQKTNEQTSKNSPSGKSFIEEEVWIPVRGEGGESDDDDHDHEDRHYEDDEVEGNDGNDEEVIGGDDYDNMTFGIQQKALFDR